MDKIRTRESINKPVQFIEYLDLLNQLPENLDDFLREFSVLHYQWRDWDEKLKNIRAKNQQRVTNGEEAVPFSEEEWENYHSITSDTLKNKYADFISNLSGKSSGLKKYLKENVKYWRYGERKLNMLAVERESLELIISQRKLWHEFQIDFQIWQANLTVEELRDIFVKSGHYNLFVSEYSRLSQRFTQNEICVPRNYIEYGNLPNNENNCQRFLSAAGENRESKERNACRNCEFFSTKYKDRNEQNDKDRAFENEWQKLLDNITDKVNAKIKNVSDVPTDELYRIFCDKMKRDGPTIEKFNAERYRYNMPSANLEFYLPNIDEKLHYHRGTIERTGFAGFFTRLATQGDFLDIASEGLIDIIIQQKLNGDAPIELDRLRHCDFCNNLLYAYKGSQKFCSTKCTSAAHKSKTRAGDNKIVLLKKELKKAKKRLKHLQDRLDVDSGLIKEQQQEVDEINAKLEVLNNGTL